MTPSHGWPRAAGHKAANPQVDAGFPSELRRKLLSIR